MVFKFFLVMGSGSCSGRCSDDGYAVDSKNYNSKLGDNWKSITMLRFVIECAVDSKNNNAKIGDDWKSTTMLLVVVVIVDFDSY